ncbi:MAG: PAS domain-containing sensor histidine kinase [Thermoflavifilum sp.]|nr:PAS domain-containing sensor histidine kinase [Thermoflavifilum sp.]
MGTFVEMQFHQGMAFWILAFSWLFGILLIGYISIFFPRNTLVRLYLLLAFTGSVWQLNDILVQLSANMQTADFFDRLTAMGWIFIGPVCVHFVGYYTGLFHRQRSFYVLSLLYLPSLFLLSLYQMNVYPHYFIYDSSWGWIKDVSKPLISVIQYAWISALTWVASWLMIRHTFRVRHHPVWFMQSFLIMLAVGVPACFGVITQFLLPLILHTTGYPFVSVMMSISIGCTFVALKKYQLFQAKDLVDEELIMSEIPLLVCCVMPNGYAAYLNTYGQYLLGVSRQTFTSLRFEQLFKSPEFRHIQQLKDSHQQALKGNEFHLLDIALQTPAGIKHLQMVIKPLFNNGKIMATLWVGKDVTDIRQMQKELMRKEYLLSEAQELAHLGNWEWDMEKNRFICSDEIFRMYGYSSSEQLTLRKFLLRLRESERADVKSLLQEAFKKRESFSFYHQVVVGRKQKYIFVKGFIKQDQRGKIMRIYGVAQDVSERVEKEKLLQQQNLELEKVNRELDRFIYSISHELRSPVASIMGIIQLCEEETNPENNRFHFQLIRESLRNLDNFIADVMHYSHNARLPVHQQPIVWPELIEEVINSMPTLYRKEIDIKFRQEGSGCEFYSDGYRIKTILQKILHHAFLYKQPYQDICQVYISVLVREGYSKLLIKNPGLDLDKNVQNRIFEMFYRTSAKVSGEGLGLYIVKEMLNKIGGQVQVYSQPGEGTQFMITIPNQKNLVVT